QWKDVALDVKWKEHRVELSEMLRALGPVEPLPGDGKLFGFMTKYSNNKDAVATAGWKRLNELRRKVARIQVRMHLASGDIHYLMGLQRAVEPPHCAFCPELRHLDVKLDGQPEPCAYDFLAGEPLVQLNCTWTPTDSSKSSRAVAHALERVALRSPLVERLDVSGFNSRFINYGLFPKLRILSHHGDFSMESWPQLCTECPLLEEVYMRCWWKKPINEVATNTSPAMQALPSLRVLRTSEVEDRMLAASILRATSMPRLTELEFDLKQYWPEKLDTLIPLIRGRSPLLEKLSVRGDDLDWGSFSSFTGLRHLELLGNLNSFTTEHVTSIIGNIPNIASLSLGFSSLEIDRITVAFTPALLEKMAEQCHQLSELDVPLNALSIPWSSKPATPACQFKRLTYLALDPLNIEPRAKEPFARYLARLCPTVKTFETILFHPDESGTLAIPSDFAEELVMESLFFKVQQEDEIPHRVSDESE
ncbi:hypothetical protein FS837_001282, partial [Tulasnella sp. UAMH 9824]